MRALLTRGVYHLDCAPIQAAPFRGRRAKPRIRWAPLTTVAALAIVVLGQTASAQPILLEHFGETADSIRLQMTPPTADRPTPIHTSLTIVDVVGIDEIANKYMVEFDLSTRWRDPRLAFDPAELGAPLVVYEGPTADARVDSLWAPYATIMNAAGSYSVQTSFLRISAEGEVRWTGRIAANVKAPFDFRRFPFDRQQLELVLQLYGWNVHQAIMVDAGIGLRPGFEIPEWHVGGVEAKLMEAIEARDSVPFSQLVVRLDIVRKRTFYIWKVFAPLIAIVALSWVVFWMIGDALGRRAGVSATAMLTIVAYQFFLSTSLPRVAYLTTMDIFTLLSFALIVLSMGINILVTRDRMQESGAGPRIDRLCRILLPAIYFGGLAFAYILH